MARAKQEEPTPQPTGLRDRIQGWINIQKHKVGRYTGYYTGGDIHPTIEDAKKVSTDNTVAQAYIDAELRK
jgi:hypothetical protein